MIRETNVTEQLLAEGPDYWRLDQGVSRRAAAAAARSGRAAALTERLAERLAAELTEGGILTEAAERYAAAGYEREARAAAAEIVAAAELLTETWRVAETERAALVAAALSDTWAAAEMQERRRDDTAAETWAALSSAALRYLVSHHGSWRTGKGGPGRAEILQAVSMAEAAEAAGVSVSRPLREAAERLLAAAAERVRAAEAAAGVSVSRPLREAERLAAERLLAAALPA